MDIFVAYIAVAAFFLSLSYLAQLAIWATKKIMALLKRAQKEIPVRGIVYLVLIGFLLGLGFSLGKSLGKSLFNPTQRVEIQRTGTRNIYR